MMTNAEQIRSMLELSSYGAALGLVLIFIFSSPKWPAAFWLAIGFAWVGVLL